MISNLNVETLDNDKYKVKCNVCEAEWVALKTYHDMASFCYNCTKKELNEKYKNVKYSMDEIRIISHIKLTYFEPHIAAGFRDITTKPKKLFTMTKSIIENYEQPSYYIPDAIIKGTYKYDQETKLFSKVEEGTTIFEILGDFYHSNPKFYPGTQ